jgi:general secretion pathway protein G
MRRRRSAARTRWAGERGISLVETLIVCALISTLASLGVGSYVAALKTARIARAIADIRTLDTEIRAFEARNHRYPVTIDEVHSPVPHDPWGSPYQYADLSTAKAKGKARKDGRLNPINLDFDLYSMGEDGRTSTPLTARASWDDVVRAREGAFIGLATDF